MNISQNVQHMLKTYNKTQKDLALHLGIATSTINNWIKLNRSIPSEYVIPICEFFDVSPYLLLTGKEKSLSLDTDKQELISYYDKLPRDEQMKLIGRAAGMADVCGERVIENKPPIIMTTMKIADVAAGAGVSTPFTLDDAFSPKEFPQDQVPPEADCGVPINGDSMEPAYPNGCIVWVKCTDLIQPGDVVIAILNGEPYCKIFQRDGLHSYNSDYDTIIINEQDNFSIFGKVIGIFDTEKV